MSQRIERERTLASIIDARIIVVQIGKGKLNAIIEPCSTSSGETCKFRDPTGVILCKNEEGLLQGKGVVECPLQMGSLRVKITENGAKP